MINFKCIYPKKTVIRGQKQETCFSVLLLYCGIAQIILRGSKKKYCQGANKFPTDKDLWEFLVLNV